MKLRLRIAVVAALLAFGLQSACVPGAQRAAADKSTGPSPIPSAAITVTSLDPAPASASVAAAKPEAEVAPTTAATRAAAEAAQTRSKSTADPDAAAASTEPQSEPEEAQIVPEEPVVAAKPRSPDEIQCGKKGGSWVVVGKTSAQACVKPTRDAGQRCSRKSDCDGLCLARSATCAPVKPLFGCNEILQDNGLRVTLCID